VATEASVNDPASGRHQYQKEGTEELRKEPPQNVATSFVEILAAALRLDGDTKDLGQ
jgi:hypothetical protein